MEPPPPPPLYWWGGDWSEDPSGDMALVLSGVWWLGYWCGGWLLAKLSNEFCEVRLD